jgi:hypothetical protein
VRGELLLLLQVLVPLWSELVRGGGAWLESSVRSVMHIAIPWTARGECSGLQEQKITVTCSEIIEEVEGVQISRGGGGGGVGGERIALLRVAQ